MRPSARGLAAAMLLALAFGASCGPSKAVGLSDAGPEVGVTRLEACLDRPDELSRPPTAGLPCELIPPGLAL